MGINYAELGFAYMDEISASYGLPVPPPPDYPRRHLPESTASALESKARLVEDAYNSFWYTRFPGERYTSFKIICKYISQEQASHLLTLTPKDIALFSAIPPKEPNSSKQFNLSKEPFKQYPYLCIILPNYSEAMQEEIVRLMLIFEKALGLPAMGLIMDTLVHYSCKEQTCRLLRISHHILCQYITTVHAKGLPVKAASPNFSREELKNEIIKSISQIFTPAEIAARIDRPVSEVKCLLDDL